MPTAAPTVMIAVRGVGTPVIGEVEQLVRSNPTAGRVDDVDARQVNRNERDLYSLDGEALGG
ncbi:MAG TPA: hypothetical protein VGF55_08240 [Gemmataceae bacterium]|jgi:hypothetical protein